MLEADGAQYSVTELDRLQRESLSGLPDEGCLFSDEVILRTVGKDHSLISERPVTLRAFRDRLETGDPMPLAEIDGISIVQRNRLLLYPKQADGHLEITGAPGFNALKYLYLFRRTRPSANGSL